MASQGIAIELLTENADINYHPERLGFTALMHAVRNGNIGGVKFLLKNGANVNIINSENKTAIILAIISNNVPMIELLLENRASLEPEDNGGVSPLTYAVRHVGAKINIMVVKILLKAGATPDADVLLEAVHSINSSPETVKLLVKHIPENDREKMTEGAMAEAMSAYDEEMITALTNDSQGRRRGQATTSASIDLFVGDEDEYEGKAEGSKRKRHVRRSRRKTKRHKTRQRGKKCKTRRGKQRVKKRTRKHN